MNKQQINDKVEYAEKNLSLANQVIQRLEESLRDYETVVEDLKHDLNRNNSQSIQKETKLRQEIDSLKTQNMSLYDSIEVLNSERANMIKQLKRYDSPISCEAAKTPKMHSQLQNFQSESKQLYEEALSKCAVMRSEMQLKDECIAELTLELKKQKNKYLREIEDLKSFHTEEEYALREQIRILNLKFSKVRHEVKGTNPGSRLGEDQALSQGSACVYSPCYSTNNSVGITEEWIEECIKLRGSRLLLKEIPSQSDSRKAEESQCSSPIVLPKASRSKPAIVDEGFMHPFDLHLFSSIESENKAKSKNAPISLGYSPSISQFNRPSILMSPPTPSTAKDASTQTHSRPSLPRINSHPPRSFVFGMPVANHLLVMALLVFILIRYGTMTQNLRNWISSVLSSR